MSNYLQLVKNTALSLLFPPLCPVCERWNGSVGDGFCPSCFGKLSFIRGPVCRFCGEPFEYDFGGIETCLKCLNRRPIYTAARSTFAYDDVSKGMILRFKHGDATYNAGFFAGLMINTARDWLKDADIVIPVPVHPMRLLKRKYNQAGLLAAKIANHTKKKYDNYNLVRVKNTQSQGTFDENKRRNNVKNAFKIKNPFTIAGKNVILIDDVYTTGATTEECARTLLAAGAAIVNVLTLAKVTNRKKNDITGNPQF